jgi:hypothetical protein
VLTGDADAHIDIGAAKRMDQGKELDRFGARPEDHEDAGTSSGRHERPFPDWVAPDKPHSSWCAYRATPIQISQRKRRPSRLRQKIPAYRHQNLTVRGEGDA